MPPWVFCHDPHHKHRHDTHTHLTRTCQSIQSINHRFVDLALRMASRMIADPQSPKGEATKACVILKAVLHACKVHPSLCVCVDVWMCVCLCVCVSGPVPVDIGTGLI
jgi:hypothetical protein